MLVHFDPAPNIATAAFFCVFGRACSGHFATDEWSSTEIGTITKKFLVIDQQDTFYRSEYDGITGLAYAALAQPTSSPPSSFYEDLVAFGATKDAFGMLLCGIMQPLLAAKSNISLHAGQLVVGGIDGTNGESYYTGPMLYSPIARVRLQCAVLLLHLS